MKAPVTTLLLCLAAMAAQAQPVYRCGSTYSAQPCPQGRIVEATDPRSAAQRAEAKRLAADERRLAAEMKRDRLADEAALRPADATSLSGPAAAASGSEKTRKTKRRRSKSQPVSGDVVMREPRTARTASKR